VIATTSPATATELRGLTGCALIYRVADPELATSLATLAGTRLLPRSLALRAGVPTAAGPMAVDPMAGSPMAGMPMAVGSMAGGPMAGVAMSRMPMAGVPMAGMPITSGPMTGTFAGAASVDGADLVPGPVMPARALLELGQGEFVLAVSRPRSRVVTAGRMVPARLPPMTDRRMGLHPGDEAGLRMGDGA
jgi:hypothetical protein